MKKPLLQVNRLTVQINTRQVLSQVVDEVSFNIHAGEIFALVGESGCGKSMTALAINRLLPPFGYLCQGSEVYLGDLPLHLIAENQMRQVRATRIGMIFQDPSLALNPVLTVGEQVREAFHFTSCKQARIQAAQLLEQVGITQPTSFLRRYPHELSGGMKQRVVIAMALAKSPDLLIADEATTALDVTTQAQVLTLIKELNQRLQMAILFITHDLSIVQQLADKVAVMYAGQLIEQNSCATFFETPHHPYSQQLLNSIIKERSQTLTPIPGQIPPLEQAFTLCRFKPRCSCAFKNCEQNLPPLIELSATHQVRCHYDKTPLLPPAPFKKRVVEEAPGSLLLRVSDLKVVFSVKKGFFKRTYLTAVDNISFDLYEGETLALVGESGCGKTTVAKAIMQLIQAKSGVVNFQGVNLNQLSARKLKKYRQQLQMIFQDPAGAMNPRWSIKQILEEGMRAFKIGTDKSERQDRINVLLAQVGLDPAIQSRFPHQLSGGQRQRVAIARALTLGASLLICDEPTSSLDTSIQAQILNLLKSLQHDLSISLLFITHNMNAVKYLAHRVAVMYQGQIVEYGRVEQILNAPQHPYTQGLLQAVKMN